MKFLKKYVVIAGGKYMADEKTTKELERTPYFKEMRKYAEKFPEISRAVPIEGLLWNKNGKFQQDLLEFVEGANIHIIKSSVNEFNYFLDTKNGTLEFRKIIDDEIKKKNDPTKEYNSIIIAISHREERVEKATHHNMRLISIPASFIIK